MAVWRRGVMAICLQRCVVIIMIMWRNIYVMAMCMCNGSYLCGMAFNSNVYLANGSNINMAYWQLNSLLASWRPWRGWRG